MAHQIILNDADYAALVRAAEAQGISIEEELHRAINEKIMLYTDKEILIDYPTGVLDDPEEILREREIAKQLGSSKPWLSEMILEDRGPR